MCSPPSVATKTAASAAAAHSSFHHSHPSAEAAALISQNADPLMDNNVSSSNINGPPHNSATTQQFCEQRQRSYKIDGQNDDDDEEEEEEVIVQPSTSGAASGSSSPSVDPLAHYPLIPREQLEVQQHLGVGTYGSVFKGIWERQDGRSLPVALKKVFMLEKEVDILSQIRHRNIIQFYGISQANPDFFIVTEYAENGSLYEHLHNKSEQIGLERLIKWAVQIARGVAYLHNEAPITVIHRDLKSKNVVIGRKFQAKLCDFGTSKDLTHSWTEPSWGGTAAWMSPEIINQREGITTAADIWSYAVMLWEMFARQVPYKGLTEFKIYSIISQHGVRLVIPDTCPAPLAELLKSCWRQEPKERPDMRYVMAMLERMSEDKDLQKECAFFLDQRKEEWNERIQQQLGDLDALKLDLARQMEALERREQALRKRESSHRNFLHLVDSLNVENVCEWNEDCVCEWVQNIAAAAGADFPEDTVDRIISSVLQYGISGPRLLKITEKDLDSLGIGPVALRRYITLKLDELRLLNVQNPCCGADHDADDDAAADGCCRPPCPPSSTASSSLLLSSTTAEAAKSAADCCSSQSSTTIFGEAESNSSSGVSSGGTGNGSNSPPAPAPIDRTLVLHVGLYSRMLMLPAAGGPTAAAHRFKVFVDSDWEQQQNLSSGTATTTSGNAQKNANANSIGSSFSSFSSSPSSSATTQLAASSLLLPPPPPAELEDSATVIKEVSISMVAADGANLLGPVQCICPPFGYLEWAQLSEEEQRRMLPLSIQLAVTYTDQVIQPRDTRIQIQLDDLASGPRTLCNKRVPLKLCPLATDTSLSRIASSLVQSSSSCSTISSAAAALKSPPMALRSRRTSRQNIFSNGNTCRGGAEAPGESMSPDGSRQRMIPSDPLNRSPIWADLAASIRNSTTCSSTFRPISKSISLDHQCQPIAEATKQEQLQQKQQQQPSSCSCSAILDTENNKGNNGKVAAGVGGDVAKCDCGKKDKTETTTSNTNNNNNNPIERARQNALARMQRLRITRKKCFSETESESRLKRDAVVADVRQQKEVTPNAAALANFYLTSPQPSFSSSCSSSSPNSSSSSSPDGPNSSAGSDGRGGGTKSNSNRNKETEKRTTTLMMPTRTSKNNENENGKEEKRIAAGSTMLMRRRYGGAGDSSCVTAKVGGGGHGRLTLLVKAQPSGEENCKLVGTEK